MWRPTLVIVAICGIVLTLMLQKENVMEQLGYVKIVVETEDGVGGQGKGDAR